MIGDPVPMSPLTQDTYRHIGTELNMKYNFRDGDPGSDYNAGSTRHDETAPLERVGW